MSYAHSDIPDAFSDASNTAPQKKKPGSTDKFFNPAGDWPMPNITAEESIYLFATAGSLTRYRRHWGDHALARWEHSA
jgi:hypothetical protein